MNTLVGACIYCGCHTYEVGGSNPPRREHIIAEAIDGDLVLEEASCKRCERITCSWETRVLKGALLGCKTYLGLRTKSPRDRPKELPLFDTSRVPERKVMVPIDKFPILLLLPKFAAPRILNPVPVPGPWSVDGTWARPFREIDYEFLKRRYGIRQAATAAIDVGAFCRMLAKAAHSFLVYKLGMCGFIPTLPHFIMGRHDEHRLYYIGGSLLDFPMSRELHEIEIEQPDAQQWPYEVVRIRFFARFGAPTFRVVAGIKLSPKRPSEVALEQVDARYSSDEMTFQVPASLPIPTGLWDWEKDAPSSSATRATGDSLHIRARWDVP